MKKYHRKLSLVGDTAFISQSVDGGSNEARTCHSLIFYDEWLVTLRRMVQWIGAGFES